MPKYLEVLGASAFVIGAYDGLKTLLGAVYAWSGEPLIAGDTAPPDELHGNFDRRVPARPRHSALGCSYRWHIPLCAWTTLSLPATFTLVAESLPAGKHAMGIGVQSLVRRIPAIVGPIVGGILTESGWSKAYAQGC